jgi:hypothetical protein
VAESTDRSPTLKVGTEWMEIEIRSDPFVVPTRFGYAPVVEVELLREGKVYTWFIKAASIAEKLEPVRMAHGSLEGVQVRVCRETAEQTAKYLIEDVDRKTTPPEDG